LIDPEMRWITPDLDEALTQRISRQFGISEVSARLLAGRQLLQFDEIEAFLSPSLTRLSDPLLVGNMEAAVERLKAALRLEESVLIFGDYDVDGVTSTVFLTHFLRRFGLNPRYVVPKRLKEGYGLSIDSLERAFVDGKPDLLIAVDCGTGSTEEVAWLRAQGISVLILDHHASKEALPEDCILVNPHVHDEPDVPWKNLCSVGLVFKFCHAFLKVMRAQGDPFAENTDLREYLDLVAMGTVADLVQLDGENRILVRHGLNRLRHCQRPGICALMEVSGLPLGEELTPVDIGFRLGPRINASGRIDEATLPIQLLLGEDWQTCRKAAQLLDDFNRERQDIERDITLQAEAEVASRFQNDAGIVVHSSDWHSGVVGIVASRLARKFNKPALVLGSESDGLLKGSGRSIAGVNLVEILGECADLLEQWGGHPMAVGLTASESKIDAFREAFKASLEKTFPEGLPEPFLSIDAEVGPADLTPRLLDEMEQLAPFGQGNPEPVFALRGVFIRNIGRLGKAHLRFQVDRAAAQSPVDCVGWNMADNVPPVGSPVDLAARFHWNVWRGDRSPRLTLMDWRPVPRTVP
jgi:single-stranded-DNA-specific exonuclease